jgi:hypothetical protein
MDVLAEAAREHTGEIEVPEVAVVCDAWDSYCRSNASAVSFGSKVVKELDQEVARMVWDKLSTSTISEACVAYWAGHDMPCPINNTHTAAAMPYAVGRVQHKLGGIVTMLMKIGAVEKKVIKHLRKKAVTNPTEFVMTYLPGAASMKTVAELTSPELVNYLVLLHLSK